MVRTQRLVGWIKELPPTQRKLIESGLLVLLACCVSVGRGQDANWDLRNYHIYNAFAFLNGRSALDAMPVGLQTFFNPLLDLPYYLLSVPLLPEMPRVVAFLAGIPYGLLIVVVLRIARLALPSTEPGAGWLAPIATAIGVSGTATWAEIGTTFGDIPIAVLVLTGIMIPLGSLAHRDTARPGRWRSAMAMAGLLVGCACGLKLTAGVFAPGALMALGLASCRRRVLGGAIAFCAGWAAGAALAGGVWFALLYRHFGNPLFPFFNEIFASPWMPPIDARDLRFLPRTVLQALFYPFYWLTGRPFVAEVGIRDPRFPLAFIAITGLLGVDLLRRLRQSPPLMAPVPATLAVFLAASYVAWEAQFSILRYAVALEALTGIPIILALRLLARRLSAREVAAMSTALLIGTVAISSRPGGGRLRHYGAEVFEVDAPLLPPDATVILADKPIGFVIPFLHRRNVTFVGIAEQLGPGRLYDEVRRRVREAAPAFVLIDKPAAHYEGLLRSYGLRLSQEACRPIGNAFDRGLMLCAVDQAG